MYSLLEDKGFAEHYSKLFSIDSLMLYSTVCGCGVDMIPVPGNISIEEIGAIILDVASLSIVLNKPLGVRLLPIPNKTNGQRTAINHDFIHNTVVKNIRYGTYPNKIFKGVYKYFGK